MAILTDTIINGNLIISNILSISQTSNINNINILTGKLSISSTLADSIETLGGITIDKSLEVGEDLNVLGNIDLTGDFSLSNTSYFYFGDETTDGSWRFYIDVNDLVFETRVAGTWTEKTRFI
jgi:hypothetical protein